jgi:hypothetical protein
MVKEISLENGEWLRDFEAINKVIEIHFQILFIKEEDKDLEATMEMLQHIAHLVTDEAKNGVIKENRRRGNNKCCMGS